MHGSYDIFGSFVGKLGTVIDGSTTREVWITGSLMNTLTTHKIKKNHLYDETIVYVSDIMGGGAACASS